VVGQALATYRRLAEKAQSERAATVTAQTAATA
jgi:hypothetical protein